MVFLPLTFCHLAVWIYNFTFPLKHRFPEVSLVNFSIFPLELALTVYLISLELAFEHTVLCLNSPPALPLAILKLSIVLDTTLGFNFAILVMHQTPTELASIFTAAVIPCISARTIFEPILEIASIRSVLFITSFNSIPLWHPISPNSFNCVYVFMCKYTLSVHR